MFTTPLRSENMPPIAPKTSGVANAKVCASNEALKTTLRLPMLERVARIPSPRPITPAATAPSPSRPRPRLKVAMPNMTAKIPIRSDQITPRAWIGGMPMKAASTPSAMPV